MPTPSVIITLGTQRAIRAGVEAYIVPVPKRSATSDSLAPSLPSAIASAVTVLAKQKKLDHRSPALTAVISQTGKGKELVVITLLPTAYSEKEETYERLQALRVLGSQVSDHAKKAKTKTVVIDTAPLARLNDQEQAALLEGITLSLYSFDQYREKKKSVTLKTLILVGGAVAERNLTRSKVVCEAVCLARDLVNTPARECTPSALRSSAAAISKAGKLTMSVFTKDRLSRMGADLMMSVFRGSNETPYLITLTYKPKHPRTIVALVGKGVTFDSGGLSLKSGAGMFDMKCDMAGAATVLATMQAVSRLKPDVEVRAYIPATENMINAQSTRPGDVVRALNGKTVEILNTDAEGRLILGDTLVIAERAKPDVIIDLATLTGAAVAALGSDYSALFSTSNQLAESLVASSEAAGERLWRMPLASEYKDRLKSMVADMKNIGGSEAGCITAALFLKEFVGSTDWAHLDIAGPAFLSSDRVAAPKGGTGFGVRTLVNYIEGL